MTNPTPHGQVPAIQRYKIGYHSDEWGLTAGLAGGRAAHEQWERARGEENECDAEKRLHEEVSESGNTMPIEWWHGWLERSDEWRNEIEHAG